MKYGNSGEIGLCVLYMRSINYVGLCELNVEHVGNGEGREKQWSEVMCNLTTQWAVPGNGPLNAGGVREINSRVSHSKNMINTPPGDAAEDEVGAAGSASIGTQGEVGGAVGSERARAERAKRRTYWQRGDREARQRQCRPAKARELSSPLIWPCTPLHLFCLSFLLVYYDVRACESIQLRQRHGAAKSSRKCQDGKSRS